MNIRWSEVMVVLMVAACLGLFAPACSPPAPPPGVESGSSAGTSEEEAPLNRPGSAMEPQADRGEPAPAPPEGVPDAHHN